MKNTLTETRDYEKTGAVEESKTFEQFETAAGEQKEYALEEVK